jgi:DNA-binding SARP family transcriptional activator
LPDGRRTVRSPRPADGSTTSIPVVVAAKVRVPAASALRRERLEARLETIWEKRLGVVIAPAGSGKTTLLAEFAAAAQVPVAWYRADTWDAEEAAILRHLEATLTTALTGLTGGWTTVSAAASALDGWSGGRALLVIDDIHTLEDTPAERTLGRFVEYAPSWLAVLIGSRVAPGFNLPRLRVAGELLEIGPDDLRFRSWEVERLFRDHYEHPVPPDDLAVLARRTEGWAAGLQLFHLATRDKSAEERRRILSAAGSGGRLLREYLTWNVMADLPEELREFLIETCVLGRLSGDLCDRLLDRSGSSALLEELFRRRIFTVEIDAGDGSYRYHEVLRSHLDRMLVERFGEDAARERFRRAGALLESTGAAAESLGAFSRAEDWAAVQRLLGGHGERLVGAGSDWLVDLPPAIIRHEPWLELASARRARSQGRWHEAIEAYERAERGFGATRIADACHDERQALRLWLEPVSALPARADWVRTLRSGLVRDPSSVLNLVDLDDVGLSSLVRGLLALAAGDTITARRELVWAQAALDDRSILATVAAIGLGVSRLLAGDRRGIVDLDLAEDRAERAGNLWLSRLARTAGHFGAVAAVPGRPIDPTAIFVAGDAWGQAFADLVQAWDPGVDEHDDPSGHSFATRRSEAAGRAAQAFGDLDSPVLVAWSRSLAALGVAEAGSPNAHGSAIAADAFGRSVGVPGARLIAQLALERVDPGQAEPSPLVAELREATGMIGPRPTSRTLEGDSVEVGGPATRTDLEIVDIRLFGGFTMTFGARPIPLDGIRPRARSLLKLLAARSAVAVHREVLGLALWPDSEPAAASRSLQVAVSAVRGLLVTHLGRDASMMLSREGDAYRLIVDPASVDIRRFDRHVSDARAARSRGESPVAALADALDLYVGDLLPEVGPEEWAVDLREEYRTQAVAVSQEAAEAALLDGDARAAITSCRTGIAIDRYHDPLWRLLIEARARTGDVSAADRDRRDYEAMLLELGLSPEVIASGP